MFYRQGQSIQLMYYLTNRNSNRYQKKEIKSFILIFLNAEDGSKDGFNGSRDAGDMIENHRIAFTEYTKQPSFILKFCL